MIALTTFEQRAADAASWQCPRCGKAYDRWDSDYDDAWDGTVSADEAATERASDCCLFIEFDHAARRRIAHRVAMGDTWLDAIAAEKQGATHG